MVKLPDLDRCFFIDNLLNTLSQDETIINENEETVARIDLLEQHFDPQVVEHFFKVLPEILKIMEQYQEATVSGSKV